MKVIVNMEIETTDYGGKEFKREIEKLLKDIGESRLIRFKMFAELGVWDNERDIDWKA